MNKKGDVLGIIVRYAILILVAIPNLWLFYKVFTPLTVYPLYLLLSIFYDVSILNSTILLINQSIPIELIGACVAGSAYYLLLILNLSTREISLKKRIKMLLWAFGAFLVLNILRIFLLSLLVISNSKFLEITHKIFWYALSTIFVVAIWFAEAKAFKIKSIPFYSDIRFLYKKQR
ncbi:MAG: pacearchaeosortase [Candidatus Pacearchaeota archaeon]|nr:pacearchaeosortase [Candidatus Pacearchaeota archaeon]